MSEDTETLNSSNETTEEVDNTEEVDETDAQSESEDLEALQEKNKRLFERAKKAEAEAKLLKAERLKREEQAKASQQPEAVQKPSEKQDGLTPMDAIAISKANIHEDDVEEVVRWARFNNITIKEALKDKTMKTILRDREEIRQTANASNTGNARRGTSKPSVEKILADAAQGNYIDDPEALAEARLASLKKK